MAGSASGTSECGTSEVTERALIGRGVHMHVSCVVKGAYTCRRPAWTLELCGDVVGGAARPRIMGSCKLDITCR